MKNRNQERLDSLRIIVVNGRRHVIVRRYRSNGAQDPNYKGYGFALCGILRENESLKQFKKRFRQN